MEGFDLGAKTMVVLACQPRLSRDKGGQLPLVVVVRIPTTESKNKHHILTDMVLILWLGWRDSNPRMPGPKPGALPLGHIPLSDVF